MVEQFVEAFKISTSGNIRELDGDRIERYKWSEKKRQTKAITDLKSVWCGDSLKQNKETRSRLALVLSRIAELECHPPVSSAASTPLVVLPAIINAFDSSTINDQRSTVEGPVFEGLLLSVI
jgi:hypothetical protein